jgi:adenylylsulfate kinase-like enzyme
MIYWFTGQPGAGKTVLANALKQQLENTFHIDGDDYEIYLIIKIIAKMDAVKILL